MIERVKIHPEAIADYLESLDWYMDRSDLVGQHFQNEFTEILERIAKHPDVPAADKDGIRWYRMKRFPYLVYYVVLSPAQVEVMAIVHSGRKPKYWTRRLSK